MNITILGAGNIGGAIGKKWAAAGHDVLFGVRDPQANKIKDLLAASEGRARAATVAAALGHGKVVLIAIPGGAVAGLAETLGDRLDGKAVIDASNRVGQPVMNNLAALRTHAPGARLYRAFQHLGWENFETPQIGGEQIDLFYCGDEGEAQRTVHGLIADVGLRPIYVGDTGQADVVDNLTRLWFALAIQRGLGRRLAFKLLQ